MPKKNEIFNDYGQNFNYLNKWGDYSSYSGMTTGDNPFQDKFKPSNDLLPWCPYYNSKYIYAEETYTENNTILSPLFYPGSTEQVYILGLPAYYAMDDIPSAKAFVSIMPEDCTWNLLENGTTNVNDTLFSSPDYDRSWFLKCQKYIVYSQATFSDNKLLKLFDIVPVYKKWTSIKLVNTAHKTMGITIKDASNPDYIYFDQHNSSDRFGAFQAPLMIVKYGNSVGISMSTDNMTFKYDGSYDERLGYGGSPHCLKLTNANNQSDNFSLNWTQGDYKQINFPADGSQKTYNITLEDFGIQDNHVYLTVEPELNSSGVETGVVKLYATSQYRVFTNLTIYFTTTLYTTVGGYNEDWDGEVTIPYGKNESNVASTDIGEELDEDSDTRITSFSTSSDGFSNFIK